MNPDEPECRQWGIAIDGVGKLHRVYLGCELPPGARLLTDEERFRLAPGTLTTLALNGEAPALFKPIDPRIEDTGEVDSWGRRIMRRARGAR